MSGMPSSSSGKKQASKSRQRRHKVADDIQETHPESVKCLLAALEKAQKGTVDTSEKEKQNQTVGARVARNRNDSGENPSSSSSSRQRTSNSLSAGSSRVYTNSNNNNNQNSCNKPNKAPLPQKIRVPKDVLDDLCFRFIEHIPEHEKFVNTRVCFQVELAHWFYVDYYVNKEMSSRSDCPNMGIREFAWSIFSNSPELKRLARCVDDVLDEWRHYKSNVPTYGGILLDKTLTKVLLVQGFYSSKNSWGFPKGKVNENETPRNCAAREVDEETGFNFKDFSTTANEPKIQKFIGDTMVRLYIIRDVPTDYEFKPKTRNEIRDIQWFTVADLPTDKNDQVHRMGNYSNNNFYTVMPFVQDLQNYIKKEQTRRAKVPKTQPPIQPPQQQKKMTPTDMLNSLSQVNMDQASMTPGKSDATPNILSNLFNNFLPNKQQSLSYENVPAYNAFVTPAPASQSQAKPETIASINSAFSPFKPVNENIAQSLLNIVKAPQPPVKSSPKIAHPIALPGRPKLPSVEKHRQEQRPTPPKQKIGPSETSAFKAIPKNKSSNSLKGDSEMGSVFGSELALDRCDTRDSIPSCATDILEELRLRGGQSFTVQLCDAWKGFKLDMTAINRDVPQYPLLS